MPALPLSCSVDVPPEAEGLVRYGLEELLRGLGLAPEWTRRDAARLAVVFDGGEGPPVHPPIAALKGDRTVPLDKGDSFPSRERSDQPEGGGSSQARDRSAAALVLPISDAALDGLLRPAIPDTDALGWVTIENERWPLPAGGAHGGDVVASAAWWLAGLQERATPERDRHGRFPYAASLQARLGDAPGGPLRPAVDAYRRWLADALRQSGVDVPGRTWGGPQTGGPQTGGPQTGGASWAVALTHDLDAVRTRRLRALVGETARGRPGPALRRALGPDRRWQSVLALRDLAARHGVEATWFVKPGAWAPEDVAHRLDARYCTFLRTLEADGHEVGWHPGYGAHNHPARLATERARFEQALGHPPALARTHFLRWTEPTTPRLLAAEGVRLDSTLGFSQHEGFRRGTAHPFRLYDPDAGRPTDLWEVPLAVMDTTLYDHRQLGADALADALAAVLDAARAAGGCAVVLWHSDMGEGAAWRDRLHALDHCVGRALRDGAAVGPLGRLLSDWRDGP